mgnify:CR=1 FL=1
MPQAAEDAGRDEGDVGDPVVEREGRRLRRGKTRPPLVSEGAPEIPERDGGRGPRDSVRSIPDVIEEMNE